MKIFLDTADIEELKLGATLGVVDGVTTNPSLMAKTGKKLEEVVKEITEIVNGPISVEAVSLDAPSMIAEGKRFSAMHKNIVVKLPMTEEGIKATKALAAEGIKVNVTLIFSAAQAMLAAKVGAAYVSPFIGRVDDTGADGMLLIEDIAKIFKNYAFKTEILAASIRHPVHVLQSAKAGAHVGTMPLKTLRMLYEHPLTKNGLDKFMADWKSAPQNKV